MALNRHNADRVNNIVRNKDWKLNDSQALGASDDSTVTLKLKYFRVSYTFKEIMPILPYSDQFIRQTRNAILLFWNKPDI